MDHSQSVIAILGIGTSVPSTRVDQTAASHRMAEALQDHPAAARFAKRIFQQCGVDTRYTCEENLLAPDPYNRYLPRSSSREEAAPSTSDRMRVYQREALPLMLQAADQALKDGFMAPADITHLITVSCTGQFLPGLDALLVKELGLSEDVQRIPFTFVGCAAGLKAIGLSKQLVSGDRSSKVLVVCVELCTLHIQPTGKKEDIFAASFFGDGASACIIGAAGSDARNFLMLSDHHTVLMPDSLDEMVWTVGDYGFELFLSPDIPKLIGRWVPVYLQPLLDCMERPKLWAVHPGGRAIIDKLQDVLQLTDEETAPSRSVLRHYGNMSSSTILFVLEEMRRELISNEDKSVNGIALAFGPGLTLEMVNFTYLHTISDRKRTEEHVYPVE